MSQRSAAGTAYLEIKILAVAWTLLTSYQRSEYPRICVSGEVVNIQSSILNREQLRMPGTDFFIIKLNKGRNLVYLISNQVPQRHISNNYDNFTHVNQYQLYPNHRSHLYEHDQRKYLNPLHHQNQVPSFYHHSSHPRNRPRPPAYEMGDEEIVSQLRNEFRVASQWTLAVPTAPPSSSNQTISISRASTQSILSKREKTPEPQGRNGFYISSSGINYPDRSVETRQSCPPMSNPSQTYLNHTVDRARDRETTISPLGTNVYYSKPHTSQMEYVPRKFNQPYHQTKINIHPNVNYITRTRMNNHSDANIFN
ncbi:hypothetical protein ACTXT7_010909 [Hymenolepis weldensis]